MSTEPLGKPVCPASNFSIEAYASNATKITWCTDRIIPPGTNRRPLNHAEIYSAQIPSAHSEPLPRREGIAYAAQPERPREIIPAAARHNQDRDIQLNQGCEMPMNRAVTAENDDRVGLLNQRCPFGSCLALKRCQGRRNISRAENCSNMHVHGI